MNARRIAEARLALRHSGSVADRDQSRRTLMGQLKNEIEMVARQKAAVREDFRARLERWETREIPAPFDGSDHRC